MFNFSHFLQLFNLMGGNERLNYFIQVAIYNWVYLVKRQANAVIGHPALGEVVGADALTALTCSNLASPCLRLLPLCFFLQKVKKASPENLHGLLPVFVLGFFILTGHN